MIVHKIVNSIFNSCTYIVHEEGSQEAFIVDCGDVQPILDYLTENSLKLAYILLTHSHFDHIYGLNKVSKLFPDSKVITNEFGSKALSSPKLNLSHFHSNEPDFVFEGEGTLFLLPTANADISLCSKDVRVLVTPGHDPSCLSYIIGDCLFTGDSYIPNINVSANWPKSNKEEAKKNEDLLKKLSDESRLHVCSGHEIFVC